MINHNHVILSKAKDLKVYVTVDGRNDCEILRYAQDDMERQNNERTKTTKRRADENDEKTSG